MLFETIVAIKSWKRPDDFHRSINKHWENPLRRIHARYPSRLTFGDVLEFLSDNQDGYDSRNIENIIKIKNHMSLGNRDNFMCASII